MLELFHDGHFFELPFRFADSLHRIHHFSLFAQNDLTERSRSQVPDDLVAAQHFVAILASHRRTRRRNNSPTKILDDLLLLEDHGLFALKLFDVVRAQKVLNVFVLRLARRFASSTKEHLLASLSGTLCAVTDSKGVTRLPQILVWRIFSRKLIATYIQLRRTHAGKRVPGRRRERKIHSERGFLHEERGE